VVEALAAEDFGDISATRYHRNLVGREPLGQQTGRQFAGPGRQFGRLYQGPAARREGGNQGAEAQLDRIIPGGDNPDDALGLMPDKGSPRRGR